MGKHLEIATSDLVSKKLIVSGSPERIRKIQQYLDNSIVVSNSRGYLLVSGYYNGCFISACSVGIGGPSIAIVLEELIQIGCNVVIRVGSCGVFKKIKEIFPFMFCSPQYYIDSNVFKAT